LLEVSGETTSPSPEPRVDYSLCTSADSIEAEPTASTNLPPVTDCKKQREIMSGSALDAPQYETDLPADHGPEIGDTLRPMSQIQAGHLSNAPLKVIDQAKGVKGAGGSVLAFIPKVGIDDNKF
jgi:hypothetical protein